MNKVVCILIRTSTFLKDTNLYSTPAVDKLLSSSSIRTGCRDFSESLSPSVSIIHCYWQLFKTVSYVNKFLLLGQHWHVHVKGFYQKTSLMSSFLFFQQCLACAFRLIRMVFVMGETWPYSCCFVGCCFLDFFKIARSVFVQFLSRFSSKRFFFSVLDK